MVRGRHRALRAVGIAALVSWLLAGCGVVSLKPASAYRTADPPTVSASALASPSPSPSPTPSPSASPSPTPPAIHYPVSGPATFRIATTGGGVAGRSGPLLRYRVAVENGIQGVDVNNFAGQVAATLSDPRGWTGTGHWRLQQVPAGAGYDFTIYLVTPKTRDLLCGDGYDRYTSCRHGDRVVLNVARWAHGVPGFPDLATYRQYMVNHETGHRLGHGHELCPGPGRPAPVMQQQTLSLHGCVPNAWPVLGGREYHGTSGQYPDPIPSDPAWYAQ